MKSGPTRWFFSAINATIGGRDESSSAAQERKTQSGLEMVGPRHKRTCARFIVASALAIMRFAAAFSVRMRSFSSLSFFSLANSASFLSFSAFAAAFSAARFARRDLSLPTCTSASSATLTCSKSTMKSIEIQQVWQEPRDRIQSAYV